jgi:uncharacterized protein GlcG (DUF336 family)
MRNKPCLTSPDVKKMMEACLTEAEKNKWNVAVSIVDEGGYLLHFHRTDGVAPISAEVSLGKARTSAHRYSRHGRCARGEVRAALQTRDPGSFLRAQPGSRISGAPRR